jgi:hypothetical protein
VLTSIVWIPAAPVSRPIRLNREDRLADYLACSDSPISIGRALQRECRADLHRHVTDATGAGLDEHALFFADPRALDEGLPRRDRDQRCRGHLDERQPARLASELRLVEHVRLLIRARRRATAAVAEIDLVAGAEPRDLGPDSIDDPGCVPADDGGQCPADRPPDLSL